MQLSAESLARSADISVETVRKIELGDVANPGFFTVVRIARAMDVDLDDFAATVTRRNRKNNVHR
jgi:transcriptional regulator with XRE-family HTH domain